MARSRGKWAKHNAMINHPQLRAILPDTRLLTEKNFYHFLKQYRHIIVKPSGGSGGTGVIQVSTLSAGQYKVHYDRKQVKVKARQLYPLIRRITAKQSKSRFIVQRKISLLEINGKPFDLRVMVQKKKGSGWLVTGIMAKVAGPGYFITNLVRSRGNALPLDTALRRSNRLRFVPTHKLVRQIRHYALMTVKQLQKHYHIRTVGLDMGIDLSGNIWLIEANFNPDKTYFKRLKDKTMYRRIMSIYKQR